MAQTKQTKRIKQPAEVSAGSMLVRDVMTWIGSFIAMPDEYRIVLAIYAIHSWVYERFDSVPYLSLTSAEPQCGKTTVLETMVELSANGGRGAQVHTDPTKVTILTLLGDARTEHKPLAIAWDECEKASRESDDRREIINSGYRSTGSVPRTVNNPIPMPEDPKDRDSWSPRVTVHQSTFSPKMFAGIGSLAPTIKDRSIVLTMRAGRSERRYRPSAMRAEAEAFRTRIVDLVRTIPAMPVPAECEWLQGREAELWEPLFTTAKYLRLTNDQNTLLRKASDLLIEMKHSDTERRYTLVRKAEDRIAVDRGEVPLGKRALLAVQTVFGADSALWTTTIIERMKATDPFWAEYRKRGIDDRSLADLLHTFGVEHKQIKIKGQNKRGYRAEDVRAALAKLG